MTDPEHGNSPHEASNGAGGSDSSYDAIVRVGGGEFLCVMSGAAIENARNRFDSIEAALAADSNKGAIKVRIAGLSPEDSADELISRADAEMPASPG